MHQVHTAARTRLWERLGNTGAPYKTTTLRPPMLYKVCLWLDPYTGMSQAVFLWRSRRRHHPAAVAVVVVALNASLLSRPKIEAQRRSLKTV